MKTFLRLAAIALVAVSSTACWNTGSGEKIGVITKLAKSGVVFKTWEGQIVRGGLSGGSGVVGAPFDFTIEDDKLAEEVQRIMDQQKEVKIHYKSELITLFRSDSNDHFLTGIEVLSNEAPASATNGLAGEKAPTPSSSSKETAPTLDRQKIADAITKQNAEMLRQNQQLIDLLKK